jgi:hypothetical protein
VVQAGSGALPAYRTSCAEYSPAASQTSTPHTVFLAQIASDVQVAGGDMKMDH